MPSEYLALLLLMDAQTRAALITGLLTFFGVVLTGIATLFAIYLKDFVIANSIRADDEVRTQQRAVFNYVDPLLSSATRLFYRLDEIFSAEGRGIYLSNKAVDTDYNKYKQESTLYRLASVLGWIRAIRKELSYLRINDQKIFDEVQQVLDEFETALADGSAAEIDRLIFLNKIWHLHLDPKSLSFTRLAVELDELVDACKPTNLEQFVEPNTCQQIANFLASKKSNYQLVINDPVPADRIWPTESLLYRDWQEMIGEKMIQPAENSTRRFDVADFGAFKKLATEHTEFEYLKNLVDKINFESETDCRPKQLWRCYQATADLVHVFVKLAEKDPWQRERTKKLLRLVFKAKGKRITDAYIRAKNRIRVPV